MKLSDLLGGVRVLKTTADPSLEILSVCCDSRKAAPGALFAAISGFETDGHKFISGAREKGAAVCVCEKEPAGDIPYVLVEDSRLALARIAGNFYGHPASHMTMIGVTGTNGKTTSTMLIKHMLEAQPGVKAGLIGTNQNLIGGRALPTERTTPESLELQALLRQMLDEGCTHVVMEVSSHSLVLHRVEGVTFEVGVFTNLTQDHLDFHGTMERYAAAKSLLFSEHCRQGVLNADDAWAPYMAQRAECPMLTYSAKARGADLFADEIRLAADGVAYTARAAGKEAAVRLRIPGMFSVYNSLDVIGCGLCLGLPLEQIAASLATAEGVKGRVEVVPSPPDCTVVIDYSHTPDSLENILITLRAACPGRLVALFGCGGDRDRSKRPVMGAIARRLADFVIVTSDNPRTEDPQSIVDEILAGMSGPGAPYVAICDRTEAIRYALDRRQPGDVILLAGKGHETYQEIDHVKHPLDERVIVADWMAERSEP